MLAAVSLAGIVAAVGIVLSTRVPSAPDCPGKITCPQTGEITCRDKRPTVDPNRPDCAGRIVCALTEPIPNAGSRAAMRWTSHREGYTSIALRFSCPTCDLPS